MLKIKVIVECDRCNKFGQAIVDETFQGNDWFYEYATCPSCNGTKELESIISLKDLKLLLEST